MESLFSPGLLQLDERPLKVSRPLVRSDLQLEKNWSDVLEKVIAAVNLWPRGDVSMKGIAKCVSQSYMAHGEVCYLHPSEGSFGIPDVYKGLQEWHLIEERCQNSFSVFEKRAFG